MTSIKRLFVSVLLLSSLAFAQAPLRPKHAEHAMVVSGHELASEAGVEVMKKGGNAVDAAVAVGFALAVVHPQAGNIGGGGFMLIRMASGEEHFVDYREKAPAAATRDMYVDAKGEIVPNLSLVGYKAVAVPGSVAGMYYAHQKWGKLPWRVLLVPAIRYATRGFPLSQEDIADFRDPDYKDLAKFPSSALFVTNPRTKKPYEVGDLLIQPELAATLMRLALNPMGFYKGPMAHRIADFMQKGGGLITEKDLADYEVKERRPIHGTYRGYEVISAPPPSSGGITLLETLNMLEGYNLSSLGRGAQAMHLTIEAYRRAFFDRAQLLGDTDFTTVPVAQLLDKRYAAAWRESIDPTHATPSVELKRPPFAGLDQDAHARPPAREPEQTTHYEVVDAHGAAVAVTTTLNDGFGSRLVVAGLGFLLNDEMDDFTSAPGKPNLFGLIQSAGNAIQPGKRPLSAMTPTIVLKDGKLFLVLGARGGPRIITGVGNVIMGVVDYGMNVQQAVAAPEFHHQWLPDQVMLDSLVPWPPDTLRGLQSRGHALLFKDYLDECEAIEVDPKTGELLGAPDPRWNAKAIGY